MHLTKKNIEILEITLGRNQSLPDALDMVEKAGFSLEGYNPESWDKNSSVLTMKKVKSEMYNALSLREMAKHVSATSRGFTVSRDKTLLDGWM